MSHIHERIPLVVACTVSTHPWGNRFTSSILNGLLQIFQISGTLKQFHGSQLHIVYPVIFFIDIRRQDGCRLASPWLLYSFLIGCISLCLYFGCKFRIEILQEACTKGKAGSIFACCAGYTCSCVYKLATYLRFTATEINRTSVTWTVAIVHFIFVGQTHTGVVTVVSNLVVQFAGSGIHAI